MTEDPGFRYDEKYYAPLSEDHPAGEAVEHYHFAEMQQAATWPRNEFGRPDPEHRPNYRALRSQAIAFLDGSGDLKPVKDLRAMLCLMLAEAGDSGPAGLARVLDLIAANAAAYWPDLHPQMEDEDDDGYMTRMEEMRRCFDARVIGLAVESARIARSDRAGDLSTRTFGIAAGKVSPDEGEFAPDADAIGALLRDEPAAVQSVAEAHAAYRHAIERIGALTAFLAEHPDLDPLDLNPTAAVLETLAGYIAPFAGTAAAAPAAENAEEGADTAPGDAAVPPRPITGPKTRDEAMALIDDLLRFYAIGARSSPVPLGLLALKDLINADFNAWIYQTASGGLVEAGINLTQVDASQLSAYEAPAEHGSAAPAIDFYGLDAAISDLDSAVASVESAAFALPAGGEDAASEEDADGAPQTAPLAAELESLRTALDAMRAARTAMEPAAPDIENPQEGDAGHSRIADRAAVKASLDQLAAFFEREEPSSPAPEYLRRLRSLVDARFPDIARDLIGEEGGDAKLRLVPRGNMR